MVVSSDEVVPQVRANLEEMLGDFRIGGVRLRILSPEGRPFGEILRSTSEDADLVLMGMKEPDDDFRTYYEHLQEMTRGLPTTLFVLASEALKFTEVLADEGR